MTIRSYAPAAALADVKAGRSLLGIGMQGEAVKWLQQKLGVAVDGFFGQVTERALRQYQTRNGLQVDGLAGVQTLGAMGDDFRPSAPPAPRPSITTPPPPVAPAPSSSQVPQNRGPNRALRGFYEVSERALAAQLPSQAKHLAATFINSARTHNLDPLLLAAISRHETGNFTSDAFRNKHNAMGISDRHGPIMQPSAEASIEHMARALSNPQGYYRNARTIGQVANIYAPIGAENDPNGLNNYWARGVSRFADAYAQAFA